MRKILCLFVFVFALVFNCANAESFDIKNYNTVLSVQKNNSIVIKEDIEVNFHEYRHGIFRTIPLKQVMTNEGNSYTSYATIKNLKANHPFSKNISNGKMTIKLGNPDTTVNGLQNYLISYLYELENDKLKDKDEFYFNIIGHDWDNKIENVYFKIYMPTAVDKDKVGFSVGKYGKIGYHDNELIYKIQGNEISGYTTKKLMPNEGITVRIELPEGYFLKSEKNLKNIINIVFYTILLTLIPYAIWFAIGKDEKVIPVINFYPPKGLNSAEVGILYQHEGKADIRNIVSLIVYLASKGYIKISFTDNNNFTLKKLKEYDGKNKYEKELMDILFAQTDFVTNSSLESSKVFYLQCAELVKKMQKIRNNFFENNSIQFHTYIIPVLCAIALFWLVVFCLNNYSYTLAAPAYFTMGIIITVILSAICLTRNSAIFVMSLILIILGNVPEVQFIIFSNLSNILNITPENLKISLIPLIGFIIAAVCIKELPKRNKLGLKVLGHILGFKKFIETAEINKIKALIKSNPEYGYDILPYAYILGIDKTWLAKIENLFVNLPSWYDGDLRKFDNFTNSLYRVSIPSTANGGISSSSSTGGGGFSGGGFGGGGGGSW